ncbi:MAG: sulfate ABC transporter substrate-binding protein [Terrimicrobiaceae bacterium]|nr:sulfate ABC transporter substrate-binding protein [Terrimicrobiaceae bacterium]
MKIPATILLAVAATLHAAPSSLLNVSYDVTREFYRDYNEAFVRHWQAEKHAPITIDQSHAGSSKQARAVLDGLQADVVTMNQDTDIQLLADAGLVAADWRTRLPDHAAPYTSTIVFLVRNGNPKGIKDWPDLVKPGVEVIIPSPKTSGNGRYSYLAAWAAAKTAPDGSDAKAREFVGALFKNAPILPPGGRDATNAFVQRGLGDALLTFESEALQIAKVFSPGAYEVVTPASSILAEAPVSVVDRVVDKRGTREPATAYLQYLWSDEGQKLAVKHFFRPRAAALLAANAGIFPPLQLRTVDEIFGGWKEAQKHFQDGGTFDAIYQPAKP